MQNKIEFSINKTDKNHIKEADIITNSGFLRPLNDCFLKHTKSGVVVPLMFESWEIRKKDIDIDSCSKRNIKVAGTWENHPKLLVFDYVKELTIKLIHDAGYEIQGNKFIVWSKDHFGEMAKKGLISNGAKEVLIIDHPDKLLKELDNVDVIFFCDYNEKRPYFGENGIINLQKLTNKNCHFGIVHLNGELNYKFVQENNIKVYPEINGQTSKMTHTLSYVGLKPVMKLLAAGFKVGQEVLDGKITKLTQPINF